MKLVLQNTTENACETGGSTMNLIVFQSSARSVGNTLLETCEMIFLFIPHFFHDLFSLSNNMRYVDHLSCEILFGVGVGVGVGL